NVVPPPYTGNFMPPKLDLSFSGLEEFMNEPIVSDPTVKKPVVETSEAKGSADKPKVVMKNFGRPLIEDWISDSEDEVVSKHKIEKKTVNPSFAKIEFVKSKKQVKSPRKTTVKQVNSARPMTNVFNKAHSTVRRPINKYTSLKNSSFKQKVNTVKDKNINAARPKAVVNTARPKAVHNAGNPQQDLQEKGVIDSGCSRHMTGKCPILLTLKKLIEDMLPFEVTLKEGKSQAELTDESHVLLKVPRKNNMYSIDLKNIVPKGGQTCLFAKATSDESKHWHRRLGHINFKPMNVLIESL
ncbi:ribonuclease H-like domain-containing protein, partial [Tanacetum coccineum]